MEKHIAIPVIDIKKAEIFYRDHFGFCKFEKWERPEMGLTALWAEDGEGFIVQLVCHSDNDKIQFGGGILPYLGFQVDNLDQKLKELEGEVEIIKPISGGVTFKRIAFVKDPNSVAIELYEK